MVKSNSSPNEDSTGLESKEYANLRRSLGKSELEKLGAVPLSEDQFFGYLKLDRENKREIYAPAGNGFYYLRSTLEL